MSLRIECPGNSGEYGSYNFMSTLYIILLQVSVDNGLGSRNNVVSVDQKHFDAYYETWDLLEKGQSCVSLAIIVHLIQCVFLACIKF